MTTSDYIAIASLVSSIVTAICASYLSFLALKHTAKPNIDVELVSRKIMPCGERVVLVFEFSNIGHWYGRPIAINTTAFFNFDPECKLLESRYGSTQLYVRSNPKRGVGGSVYLKATGLKLTYGEASEAVHIVLYAPQERGVYCIRVVAFSDNGANLKKEFEVECR